MDDTAAAELLAETAHLLESVARGAALDRTLGEVAGLRRAAVGGTCGWPGRRRRRDGCATAERDWPPR